MADRKDEDKGINDEALDGIVSGEGTSRQETDFGPQIVAEDPNSAGQASDDEIYDAEIIEEEYDEDAEIDNFEIGDNPGTGTYGPEEPPEEEEEQVEETPEEPVKTEKKKGGIVKGIIIGVAAALIGVGAVLGGLFGGGVLSTASQDTSASKTESAWSLSRAQQIYFEKFVKTLGVSATTKVNGIAGLVPVMNADAKYSMQLCLNIKDQEGVKLMTINFDDEAFAGITTTKELTEALRDIEKDKIGEVKTFKKLDTKTFDGQTFKESFETLCLEKEAGYLNDVFVAVSGGKETGKVDALGVTYDGNGDIKGYFQKDAVLTLTDKVNGVKSEDVMSAFRSEFGAEGMSYQGRVKDDLKPNLKFSSYEDEVKKDETEEKTEEEVKKDEIVSEAKKAISSDKKFDGWDITL